MARIPSGEPTHLDSRLRGNDGCSKVSVRGNDRDVGDLSAAEGYRDRYFAAQPRPSSVVVSGLYSQPTQPA